jgi:hypothetical protein
LGWEASRLYRRGNFWDAFCESKAFDERQNIGNLDWDGRMNFLPGLPEVDNCAVRLSTADIEVANKVLGKTLVIEPANRAVAAEIVAMMPAAWDTMESGSEDNVADASNLPPTTLVPENPVNRELSCQSP